MTKLLEQAIAHVRELPKDDQDAVAIAVLSLTSESAVAQLDNETRDAIREGLEQASRGEFATDNEVTELWNRFGL